LDLGHLMSLKRTKFVPPLDGYCETYIREKFCSVEHFIPCEQSKVNNYSNVSFAQDIKPKRWQSFALPSFEF
ncbi:MAG: hypothetical protein ACK5VA_04545, partial [Pseudanabaena sp.]